MNIGKIIMSHLTLESEWLSRNAIISLLRSKVGEDSQVRSGLLGRYLLMQARGRFSEQPRSPPAGHHQARMAAREREKTLGPDHPDVKRARRGTRKKNCRTECSLLSFNNFDRQL